MIGDTNKQAEITTLNIEMKPRECERIETRLSSWIVIRERKKTEEFYKLFYKNL